MGFNYILGGSGSGKTELCLNQIISAQNNGKDTAVIYIVPEQFSLQSEKNLLRTANGKGLMRAKVLSFQRLSYYVFAELGGMGKPILEDTGKNMVLRKVLLETGGKLKFYKGAADKQGFIDNLSDTVTEFYQYDISLEKMLDACENIEHDGNLLLKMQDLYLIFKSYKEYLEKNYITSDETLDILADEIGRSKLARSAEVWVDGFKSFTPQEYKVIEKLLAVSASVTFCMTVDELRAGFERIDAADPFYETKNAINIINTLAYNNAIKQDKPVFLEQNYRHVNNPAVKYLEKNFFDSGAAPFLDVCRNIKLAYAGNMHTEIHCAAKNIMGLIMERGYKFNEIAVVSASPDDYMNNIKTVFSQYDIPFFIDIKKNILSHPLAEFIRSALEIISYNWQYENVFRLLKTNILPIAREKVDLLENYVLAYGIKSNKWAGEWIYGFSGGYERFDKEEMNALRLEILSALEPLTARFNRRNKYPVRDISEALYCFLVNCGVENVLSRWISDMRENGNIEMYREHNQIWGKVVSLLDKTVEIFDKEQMTIAEYGKILEAGFSGMKMGLAPHSLDQVIIGDLHRTRLPEVKALFILGANEGILPGKTAQAGLLSDEDRRAAAKEMSIKLAGDNISRAREEQLSIYNCVTKPSEFLSVSCFLGGLDGKSFKPSVIMDRISELLPNAKKIIAGDEPGNSANGIFAAKPTFNGFTGVLRGFAQTGEVPDIYKDTYSYLITHGKYKEKLEEIKKLLSDANKYEKLDKESINKLYLDKINSSVSKLEKYVQCPFSYYAQYNLLAGERKIYEVADVDLGNIFHTALEKFSAHLKDVNISMRDIDNNVLAELAEKSVDETFALERNEILSSSGQYKYLSERVKEISVKSIWALAEHMRSGEFELAFTEASFSGGNKGAEGMGTIDIELESGKTMYLEGRIDRVDIADLDDGQYIKIVDYKSGGKKFSFAEAFYGIQLQLIIYMDAFIKKYGEKLGNANNKSKVNPAADFYFGLMDPVIDYSAGLFGLNESEIQGLLLKQYKMSGAVSDNPKVLRALDSDIQKSSDIMSVSAMVSDEGFKMLMDYSMKKARQIGNDILSGNISAAPYRYKDSSGCKFCTYKPICKTDAPQNAQRARKFKPMNEKDAVIKIFSKL